MRYRVIGGAVSGVNNKVFQIGDIVTEEELIFNRFSDNRPSVLIDNGYLEEIPDKKK